MNNLIIESSNESRSTSRTLSNEDSASEHERSISSVSQLAVEQFYRSPQSLASGDAKTLGEKKIEEARAVNEADEAKYDIKMFVCGILSILTLLVASVGITVILALTAPAWVPGLVILPTFLIFWLIIRGIDRYKHPVNRKLEEINNLVQRTFSQLGERMYPIVHTHFAGTDRDLHDLKDRLNFHKMDLQAHLFHPAYAGRITQKHFDAIQTIQKYRLQKVHEKLESFSRNHKESEVHAQFKKEMSEWYQDFWKYISVINKGNRPHRADLPIVNELSSMRENWIRALRRPYIKALSEIRDRLPESENRDILSNAILQLQDIKSQFPSIDLKFPYINLEIPLETQVKENPALQEVFELQKAVSKALVAAESEVEGEERALKEAYDPELVKVKESVDTLIGLLSEGSEERREAHANWMDPKTGSVVSTEQLLDELTAAAKEQFDNFIAGEERVDVSSVVREARQKSYHPHPAATVGSVEEFVTQYNQLIKELEPLTGLELSSYRLSFSPLQSAPKFHVSS